MRNHRVCKDPGVVATVEKDGTGIGSLSGLKVEPLAFTTIDRGETLRQYLHPKLPTTGMGDPLGQGPGVGQLSADSVRGLQQYQLSLGDPVWLVGRKTHG